MAILRRLSGNLVGSRADTQGLCQQWRVVVFSREAATDVFVGNGRVESKPIAVDRGCLEEKKCEDGVWDV